MNSKHVRSTRKRSKVEIRKLFKPIHRFEFKKRPENNGWRLIWVENGRREYDVFKTKKKATTFKKNTITRISFEEDNIYLLRLVDTKRRIESQMQEILEDANGHVPTQMTVSNYNLSIVQAKLALIKRLLS